MLKFFFSPLFAVCVIGFGLFSIFAGHKNTTEFSALLDHGKTAKAEITKLEWKEKTVTHADSGYTAYVQFETAEGQKIHSDMHITGELGHALRNKTGPSVITVRYLPESPTTFADVNRIDLSTGDAQSQIGRFAVGAGLLLLVVRFLFNKFQRGPSVRSPRTY